MKKTLLTLAFALLATVASYAQGTITFRNNALTQVRWENPVTHAFDVVPANAPLVYGVFWGTTADRLDLNTGPLGLTGANAGIIEIASPYGIQGAAPTAAGELGVFMKIAGWTSSFGRDFAAAKVTPGGATPNYYGETGVRQIKLAAEAGPGTVIWTTSATSTTQFQPLRLAIVPEPSVIALGVLGVGALLLRRRKTA